MKPLIALLVFAIAGPPIGALILLAVIVVAMYFGPESATMFRGTKLAEFGQGVALLVVVGYLFGGLQALFVAIVAAITQGLRWSAGRSFMAVVIAGLVAGIGFLLAVVLASNTSSLSLQSFIVLGVHIGAAVGCWLIMQGVFRLMRRAPANVIR